MSALGASKSMCFYVVSAIWLVFFSFEFLMRASKSMCFYVVSAIWVVENAITRFLRKFLKTAAVRNLFVI